MKARTVKSAALAGVVVVSLGLVGCGGSDRDLTQGSDSIEATSKSQKLNLSHVECTDDGRVLAHFVLLFAGKTTPATLSGTWSGGTFGPVAAYKNSGNVWHYEVFFPTGYVEILTATVGTVSLHNPSEYSGNYECGPTECDVEVAPQDLLCTSQPLGSPGAECGAFGLVPSGKDDGLSGLTFPATMDAYVALVKSGSGGCGGGESAYRVYVGVNAGDVLSTPVDQNISHVTYCDCAVPESM
jgi:hypothetical protein